MKTEYKKQNKIDEKSSMRPHSCSHLQSECKNESEEKRE